ncbi:hypothetical protein [Mesorhizobium sp. M0589]|uniref:hypothetical protein n=1 Tax=Mesorhizobium sp. M0589 TaxID=2956965 RepID=UPI0033383463
MSSHWNAKAIRTAEAKQTIEEWAKANGLHIEHCGDNHLKIFDINFYPSTGTFIVDGRLEKEPGKGPSDFIKFVELGAQFGSRRRSVIPFSVTHPKIA